MLATWSPGSPPLPVMPAETVATPLLITVSAACPAFTGQANSAAAMTVTSRHQPIAVVDSDTRCRVAWAISSRPVSITASGNSGV
jgi:hypothetical protein